MDEFFKMDVFFVVTTIAVIVIAGLTGFVLWRLQRILKNVEYVSKQVAIESDIIRQDLAELRSDIRGGKGRIESLFGFLNKFTKRTTKKS